MKISLLCFILLTSLLCAQEPKKEQKASFALKIEKHLLKKGFPVEAALYNSNFSDLAKLGEGVVPILIDMFSIENYPFQIAKTYQNKHMQLLAGIAIADIINLYPKKIPSKIYATIHSAMLHCVFNSDSSIKERAAINLFLLGDTYFFDKLSFFEVLKSKN